MLKMKNFGERIWCHGSWKKRGAVVLKASTLGEATEMIQSGEVAEAKVNVALLDRSLSAKAIRDDGRRIAAALREVIPAISIVSLCSLKPGEKKVEWADASVEKGKYASRNLPKVIADVLRD